MKNRNNLIVANVRQINSPNVRGITHEGLVLTRTDLDNNGNNKPNDNYKAGVR